MNLQQPFGQHKAKVTAYTLGVYRRQFFSLSTGYRVLRRISAEFEYLTNYKNWKKCKHSICFVSSSNGFE